MDSVLTIPNLLTFLRMALIPVFAILLYYKHFDFALLVFFIAGLSDSLDGYIARRFNQESNLGRILDPIADKLLMTVSYIGLALPFIVTGVRHLPIPFWVVASVIGRDILIVAVAAAIALMTKFRGFKPSFWGKVSTVIQINAIGLILIIINFPSFSIILPTIYVIVALFSVISGVHYIYWVAKLMNEAEKSTQ
jgi:cardiolipin synthase (CMP-forming)